MPHVRYTNTHSCQSHLNHASPIDIFSPFCLTLSLFTFIMAFSFHLCKTKTQTALHAPENNGNLFTFKMPSTLQRVHLFLQQSVEVVCFFQRAICAWLLGEEGNRLAQISFLLHTAGIKQKASCLLHAQAFSARLFPVPPCCSAVTPQMLGGLSCQNDSKL